MTSDLPFRLREMATFMDAIWGGSPDAQFSPQNVATALRAAASALEAQDAALAERNERADLAEAYMAGMRAACGQPDGPPYADNGEPYSKGRYNFQYQEGFALNKELLDIFARRTDAAQGRAEQAEARLAAKDAEIATLRATVLKLRGGIVSEHKQWNGSWFCRPGCTNWHDGYHVEACRFIKGQPDADREARRAGQPAPTPKGDPQ